MDSVAGYASGILGGSSIDHKQNLIRLLRICWLGDGIPSSARLMRFASLEELSIP